MHENAKPEVLAEQIMILPKQLSQSMIKGEPQPKQISKTTSASRILEHPNSTLTPKAFQSSKEQEWKDQTEDKNTGSQDEEDQDQNNPKLDSFYGFG